MNLYKIPRGQMELFAKDLRYGIKVDSNISYRPDLLVNKCDNVDDIQLDSFYMNFSNTSALRMKPSETVIIPSEKIREKFGKNV